MTESERYRKEIEELKIQINEIKKGVELESLVRRLIQKELRLSKGVIMTEQIGREELVRRIEEQRNAAQSETRSQSESMFKNKLAEIVLLLRGAQNAILTNGISEGEPLNKATDNIERAIEIAKMLEQRETAK